MNDIALYIDPPSHHFLQNRLFNVKDGPLTGDQILAPYAAIREFFNSRGIPVCTADYLPVEGATTQQKIYVSLGILTNYRRLAKRKDVSLSACFAMDCPIVDPPLYQELKTAQRYFKRIFSWSESQALEPFVGGPLRCIPFRWPQSFNTIHSEIWNQNDRKFLVMINANKIPKHRCHELYTARMKAVEFFSRTGAIDLYGVGWEGPSFRIGNSWMPNTFRRLQHRFLQKIESIWPDPLLVAARRVYKGPAISKAQILGQYTFAICFENMILKGWITEKIFDCFFAGTIPIYWGAPDIEQYVPGGCFIDMRKFKGYGELEAYLKSLGKRDIYKYKGHARDYLSSPQFKPFTKEAFVDLFKKIVEEDAGIRF